MANIAFGNQVFDANLVIFDKDGTLIDFSHLWARKTILAVERLAAGVQGDAALRDDLYCALGYDAERELFAGQGPILTAAMSKLYTIAAAVLYRHGCGWLDAELAVEQHFIPAMTGDVAAEMVRPTADLLSLFAALTAVGVHIAVITSDDHRPALATLRLLDVASYVQFLAGADDAYPPKPAPDAILAACAHFGAPPTRTAMVGDSTTDLLMGQRAGVGLRIGVLTGVMEREALEAYAHGVLGSVGEIAVQ
jgi:phosphoglycolate phosphatase-like HAD superfamily hydrolase